jgi:hypothetical protein
MTTDAFGQALRLSNNKKMIMKYFIVGLFLCSILFSSCKKAPVSPLNSDKEIAAFKLKKSLNASLAKTIRGKIGTSKITLNIPDSVDSTNLIASFEFEGEAVYVGSVKQKSGVTPNDFTKSLSYTVKAEEGSKKSYQIIVEPPQAAILPHIYVNVDNDGSITSKEHYVHGDLKIDGKGQYEDYKGRTKIRGRGNTTWGYPKKPYKLKLINKAPLLGLAAYKKWILLANWRDGSLLINSIPYETARLLGMPFANHMIPVELTLNGKDQGIYVFTEQKEVGKGRINVGKDGLLLELDSYYDEPYKFKSDYYHLPVMIHYPKLEDMPKPQAQNKFDEIKNHFEKLEKLVHASSFPNNNYLDDFSDTAYVDYMIVYQLTDNEEINRPGSTYMNKAANGKFRMGIVWDFDSGFGYLPSDGSFFKMSTAAAPLFWNSQTRRSATYSTKFFSRFMEDPHIQALFKKRWNWFKTNKYPVLKKYIKNWAEIIVPAYKSEHDIWGLRGSSGNLDTDLQRTLDWLDTRVNYIDSYVSGLK